MSSSPPRKKHLSAKPTRNIFDAWNTSSSGHQRAENRLSGSTSWRDSRTLKLASQFSSGAGGGKRVADTVGAGSEGFGKDGRLENGGWERGAKGLRTGGQLSVLEAFAVKKSGVEGRTTREEEEKARRVEEANCGWADRDRRKRGIVQEEEEEEEHEPKQEKWKKEEEEKGQVFKGLTIYVNGCTAPTISDHQLKKLLVSHGANLSIALGRRTVTHVILGRPNGTAAGGHGSGGGLAATKIQKEIASKVGNGVKFVTVEWVMESVKQGKRAPEGRFEALRLAPKGTANLVGMFSKAKG